MSTAFLDESGDLSFNFDIKQTPNYTYLIYDAIKTSGATTCDEIFISRRHTKKMLNEKMIKYITDQPNTTKNVKIKIHHAMSGLQVVDFLAHAVFCEYEFNERCMREILLGQDKTLVAFAEGRPALSQQGNYLSYPQYIKPTEKGQPK